MKNAVGLNRLLLKFALLCHVDIHKSFHEDKSKCNFLGITCESKKVLESLFCGLSESLKSKISPSNFIFSKKSRYHIQIKLIILNFWTKLSQKDYFQSEKDKEENHQRILHIRISLDSKFHLQQTILISGYFRLKADNKIE